MRYRKFRADKLFDGQKMRDENDVLIMTEAGSVVEIIPAEQAGDDILYQKGILSPGFINCHCHLELSHMKNQIPEKTGLVPFVSQVIKNRHVPDPEIINAIEKAEEEMLNNGIVAVGDICNNTLSLAQKLKRRMWYHNFIEASGFQPLLAEQRFQHALEIFREYDRYYSIPVGANSIVPHAPYSVSEELWEKIIHFPGNRLLTIHNQESIAEDELFVLKQGDLLKLYEAMGIEISFFQSSGKSSFQTCISRFLSNQQVICVHNVHTSKDDLLHLKSGLTHINIYWCLCPNANLYISGQLPDIELLADESRNIVLGTDSLASNHQLNIATEMQTIHKHFPLIPAEQLFRWATINGAKALQMDAVLGSFERSKQPGVAITEPDFSRTKRLL